VKSDIEFCRHIPVYARTGEQQLTLHRDLNEFLCVSGGQLDKYLSQPIIIRIKLLEKNKTWFISPERSSESLTVFKKIKIEVCMLSRRKNRANGPELLHYVYIS
jgi:hypothetical protein